MVCHSFFLLKYNAADIQNSCIQRTPRILKSPIPIFRRRNVNDFPETSYREHQGLEKN